MSQELDEVVQRLSTLKQSLNRRSPMRRSPRRSGRRSPSPKLRKSPQAKLRKQGSKRSSKRVYTAKEKQAIQRLIKSLKKARKTLHKM